MNLYDRTGGGIPAPSGWLPGPLAPWMIWRGCDAGPSIGAGALPVLVDDLKEPGAIAGGDRLDDPLVLADRQVPPVAPARPTALRPPGRLPCARQADCPAWPTAAHFTHIG